MFDFDAHFECPTAALKPRCMLNCKCHTGSSRLNAEVVIDIGESQVPRTECVISPGKTVLIVAGVAGVSGIVTAGMLASIGHQTAAPQHIFSQAYGAYSMASGSQNLSAWFSPELDEKASSLIRS